MVETSPFNMRGVSSIQDQKAKIPHAYWPKKKKRQKQKQYCNNSINTTTKMVHNKKKKIFLIHSNEGKIGRQEVRKLMNRNLI